MKNILVIVILVLAFSFLKAEVVTRAAIDIGSGECKLSVADVDTETGQIIKMRHENHVSVELQKDLAANAKSSRLSRGCERKLMCALKNFKEEAAPYVPTEWSGVGTSVFRKAKNGQDVLDQVKEETGISIQLLPQTEEAKIGFLTGVAASGMRADQVIVWDSGSGSFQISTQENGQIEMYGAEFAFVPALQELFKIRQMSFSEELLPNPIKLEEAKSLVTAIHAHLPIVPEWLCKTEKTIVGFGGETSIFSLGAIATKESCYTKEQVWKAIEELCGKGDDQLDQFPNPSKAVVGLILLYSVMDHCHMERLHYKTANGSCPGILISQQFWSESHDPSQ